MTKIYQFNFDRGHAYSIGEGFGADSLEGIGFLNFPQGYAYMRNLIYREDGWVRPPFSVGNYHSSAGTGALKGVYFAIDGLYAYTGNNQLLFSQGGNGDWQTANWVGTGSEPAIGVDANRNIQWFDDYGLPLFTSPVATEPVFWAYQKQDIFGDIDIPPTDTGGEPVPDPPIITDPTNPYVNPYPNAQYYYHNAGRTNWIRGINKNFSPKGTGQVYKTFDAGEAIGLAEGGLLFGYPKVYSLPSCDQTGEDLPEDFIPWGLGGVSDVGLFNNIRYKNSSSLEKYDYINLTKTTKSYASGTNTLLQKKDYGYINYNKTSSLATFKLYDWDNVVLDTILFSDFNESASPAITLSNVSTYIDLDGKVYINVVTSFAGTGLPDLRNPPAGYPLPPDETLFSPIETTYYANQSNTIYQKNYLYDGENWILTGQQTRTYTINFKWTLIWYYSTWNWSIGQWQDPYIYEVSATEPTNVSDVYSGNGYSNYLFYFWGDTLILGRSKYNTSTSGTVFEGFSWDYNSEIITDENMFALPSCSNNDNAFKYVSFSNKDLTYKTVNIDGTDTDKTINLPLSANSSNFQLKESVITDDNIVYFVYHDLTNSKIGIIGIDIIENLVYYSYEENCTSFPTNQKLFHYGSYIGFKAQNNWKIIN